MECNIILEPLTHVDVLEDDNFEEKNELIKEEISESNTLTQIQTQNNEFVKQSR